jgi:acid phosphatase
MNAVTALAGDRLIFAIDLVRHGDRNPVAKIPKSPHLWDGELGALTQAGTDRELQLGKTLREEYVSKTSLLSKRYDPATLYVRSTDTTRTIGSAKALLSGLYPSEFRGGLEIPIEVVKKEIDDLLLVQPSEKVFDLIKVFFWKRSRWKVLTKNKKREMKKWTEVTGMKLENFDDLDSLADNLLIRKYSKIPLPSGMDAVDAENIIALAEIATISIFELKEISKPTGIRIISSISRYFDDSIRGKSKLKYVLYSAHDATIMSVLSTLGVKFRSPGFGARLHFGLFQVGNEHKIRVTLENQPILIPACGGKSCSLPQLESISGG